MTLPLHSSLADQIDRVARVMRRKLHVFRDERVTLSHGAGGKASHNLIEGLLVPLLSSPALETLEDSAVLSLAGARMAFTTDSYVVTPLFFPGGDIGSLAVHGTINDLAMAGAQPLALSLGLVLEEGLDIDVVRRVAASIGAAAASAGTQVVTGDTKVVPRGKADQLFVNVSGVGVVPANIALSLRHVRPGDRVLLSGYIGDHGIAVMLAREALEIEADIRTDSAPLHRLVKAVLAAAPILRGEPR
jgi:hydrogenase expression/formation protein HypE